MRRGTWIGKVGSLNHRKPSERKSGRIRVREGEAMTEAEAMSPGTRVASRSWETQSDELSPKT